MKTGKYIALLRGINVGGNNLIKMKDLKESFQNMGFENVDTYIQSGNVLFSSKEQDRRILTDKIEQYLTQRFAYQSKVIILSIEQLQQIVESAPILFKNESSEYKYNILFLSSSLSEEEVLSSLKIKEGVDQIFKGEQVVYFIQLKSKITQSHLPKIIGLPIYKEITVRNWNTTKKLLLI